MHVNEIVTQKIIEQLDKGTVPWHQPWLMSGYNKNLVSKKPYQGINVFLLGYGFQSPWWVTYKQAMDLGGTVKKGEKGTMIVYFKINEYLDENSEDLIKKVRMLRYYNVFNVEQTEGLEKRIPATMSRIVNRMVECDKIVDGYLDKPQISDGDIAAYVPRLDHIIMPPINSFENNEAYYAVLFHEFVHSTGHAKRLGRKEIEHVKPFGSQDYSREELVAEIGAIFLYNKVGITRVFDNSLAYIQNWRKRLSDDPQLIISAASQAQKAYDHILKIQEQKEVD